MLLGNVKVARISTVPYSVVLQLKNQIEYLAAQGALVTVVTSCGSELSQFEWRENLCLCTVEMARSARPFSDLIALYKLTKMFRRNKFDIVHSTTPKAGLLTAVAAWLSRVPVRLHTFTGQRWVTLKGPLLPFAKMADKLICSLNTYCYADSASQRRFLISHGIANPKKIGVIGAGSLEGVDLQRFDRKRFPPEERRKIRERLGIKGSARVILFVGRICADKGVRELLAAFRQVCDAGVDANLVMVGPFDQTTSEDNALEPAILAEAPRIQHIGYSTIPETYIAAADILCLPSYREGFGTVVIEAAAMEIPAVGTDIYGLSDAIEDGVTGILVPARDADALAKALVRLLTSQQLISDMGRAARIRCEALFDSRVVVSAVASEYRRLLSAADLLTS